MATVGRDFETYAHWLDGLGITRDGLREIADAYTAQAYITTDLDDNQIIAFHPGAMNHAHTQPVSAAGVKIGTVSPDGREGMLLHARQFAEAGIPFLFDPGQGLPMFDGAELRAFIEQASWVAVNDYESEMLMERTGWTLKQIAQRVDALIVTRGGKGSQILTGDRILDIPCARATALADPTGCGDAYRGGLLYGLLNELDWETTGRIASLMGAIKIERPGPQNHSTDLDRFRARYVEEFRRQAW
jgi:Sugar kinases, ribokinase family